MSNVICETTNGITLLTINRPDVYNCLNRETLHELSHIADELAHSKESRVIVITGAGDKAFCSGADLKERRTFTEDDVRAYIALIGSTFRKMEQLPQPTIAAINGVAFGGGMELALACDLRVADETATMGLTEASLGIIPGAGGTQRLPRLIGKTRAKELIFTAQRISASQAESWGLLNYTVESGTALNKAMQLAEQINQNAPLSLIRAKSAIDQGMEVELAKGLLLETEAYETLIPTRDRLEGLAAFKEKRKPQYIGE